MENRRSFRVAVAGAGPRGISVVERLLARHAAIDPQRRPALAIRLIDPFNPGPGHVWRTGQSRLFLMNTPALFPTVVPAGATAAEFAPSPTGLSFDQWRTAALRDPAAKLSDGDREELAALDSASFPSRALYGRYLEWTYARLEEAARRTGVRLEHVRGEVLDISRPDTGSGWNLSVAGEGTLAADAVVLALGHLPAGLSTEQDRLRDAAARHGLTYLPPAVPSDVDFSVFPAGETVLVRGLGLNFFDIMIHVTTGRGGRFLPSGESAGRALRYEPSGREPVLAAASRRGTPYRAKARLASYVPRGVRLRYLTPQAAFAFREADGQKPGFDHDLWPLLHRDAVWAYYSTLARTAPGELLEPAEGFLDQLRSALDLSGPAWDAAKEEVLHRCVPAPLRTNLEGLAQPLGRRPYRDAAELDAAVLAYLEDDAAGSDAGEDDPLKMAIGALNAGRTLLKAVVADGGLAEASWLTELRGWFEPLVEGLASGPPPERIEQLAALVRAGVVHFVGPDPRFDIDEARGVFTGTSPWTGTVYAAGTLVEAMMPPNRVDRNLSPLLGGMLRNGLARPKVMMAADGTPVVTPGLDVTLPPYRPVDISGEPQEDLYLLGLQLSSVQWGTAIAAEAGSPAGAGSRTLRDADQIAQALLATADARPAADLVRDAAGDLSRQSRAAQARSAQSGTVREGLLPQA